MFVDNDYFKMKTNAWAVWGPLRLGGPGPGPAGPLDKTVLNFHLKF